ncbi:MAG TPA: hypothetical protein VIL36_01110 [Acidimicrobiales bacterium]
MTRFLVLVWLVGMLPALWVMRKQWIGKPGAGIRGLLWAMAWPIWILFWMAEDLYGDRGDRRDTGDRGGEARRRR